MRTVKWLYLAVLLAGCASHPAQGATDVRIVFTERPPELPFDPEDGRLRASQTQLAELLGHPIVFDIDAALLPQWRGSFRTLLVEAIENVARDVRTVKEREPKAFAAQLSKLSRIECRYVATRPSRRSELTPDGQTLRVFSAADDGDLVPRGLVAAHVSRAYEVAQNARFGKETAQSIGRGERAAFFEDLSHRYDKGDGSLAESVRADAIRSVVELDSQATGELRTRIRHWLANDAAEFFAAAYLHRGAEVKRYASTSRFRGAELAFATWVDGTQKALPEDDRLALLKHLYPRPFTQDREPGRAFVTFAFPGMHRDAILFDVIDEWIQDGHRQPDGRSRSGRPMSATPLPKPKALQEWVVCPRPKSLEGPRILGPHCDDTLYDRAHEEPEVAARLGVTLLAKKDAILTETVFANLAHGSKRLELAIAQWRKLDEAGDAAAARVAAQVMAELAEQEAPELLVAEARARLRGSDRGTGLYLLAVMDRYARAKVDWPTFGATFGPIRDVDFQQFLATGPHAVTLVPVLWPALETSVKKAAPLIAVYDAFAKAPETRAYDMQDPWKAWRTIHDDFCRDGLTSEVALLRGYYTARLTRDPENARLYADFVEETTPPTCRVENQHHVSRQRVVEAEQRRKKAADDQRRRESDPPRVHR